MHPADGLRFALTALRGGRVRSLLMLLAMGIGIASVMLLTALGDGARRFVVSEFSSLGTHLLIVLPGKNETSGGAPPLVGGTPRDLTLDDALALTRRSSIARLAPLVLGSVPVSHGSLEREVTLLGSTSELLPVRNLELARGRFLPAGDPHRGGSIAVLGSKLKRELFGNSRAIGQWVRVGDRRFRVIGVLKPMGESIGMDIGDLAIIPVATAQSLFNSPGLFRILVQAAGRERIEAARKAIIDTIRERHDGEDDITVITQNALLSTFDGIFRSLTYTVSGIAAISLAVAGILIMNVMLVAVSQRTSEIGLLKALGSPPRQILGLFLTEAALLSLAGALVGMAVAWGGVTLMGQLFPQFPLQIPYWSLLAALAVSLVTGLLFGMLPARRAARLDPVQALTGR